MPLAVLEPSRGVAGPSDMPPLHWREGDKPDVLDEIRHPAVNVAVWQRSLSEEVAAYASHLVELGVSLSLDRGPVTTVELADQLPDRRGRWSFCADVAAALHRFADLTGDGSCRASLDTVVTDKCRRFHVDYYKLRWVSTYVGLGTEWLRDEDVDADVMARDVLDADAFNAAVAVDPCRIRRLGEGDVLFMKGRGARGPTVGFGGPIHRSPPILALGQRRLVLTLTF